MPVNKINTFSDAQKKIVTKTEQQNLIKRAIKTSVINKISEGQKK